MPMRNRNRLQPSHYQSQPHLSQNDRNLTRRNTSRSHAWRRDDDGRSANVDVAAVASATLRAFTFRCKVCSSGQQSFRGTTPKNVRAASRRYSWQFSCAKPNRRFIQTAAHDQYLQEIELAGSVGFFRKFETLLRLRNDFSVVLSHRCQRRDSNGTFKT